MKYNPIRFSRTMRKPTESLIKIDSFKGNDLGHTALNVTESRSPSSLNMLRDEIGQIRKRMGWHTVENYDSRINGAYVFNDKTLIHSGAKLFDGETEIGQMADNLSQGWTLDSALYLLDGESLKVCSEDFTLKNVSEVAYVPTVIISRDPEGGGVAYEPYNLIGTKFTNAFYGKASVTAYQLTDDDLDSTPVTAQVLNSNGEWIDKTENTDFTVNRETGVVTFSTAPGVSPVEGEDNVKITASKVREGYADRINKCTISTLYGVNGAADRLFVSGNPDYPNRDWWSAQNDPTMFGDTDYSMLGQDNSAVIGYSVVSNRLAAHKDEAEDGRNVILRQGEMDEDGKAIFPIVNTLIGEGGIAPFSHRYVGKEPLFLTRRGVFAIMAEDITGEKYSQVRSSLLNAKLIKEENLESACAAVHNDFYMLFVNGRVYCLDALQKTYTKNEPYSSFQYEGYVLDNIPARVAWTDGNKLCFGTADGRVCEFYTDKNLSTSFKDDGTAINAYWDTPFFAGQTRFTRKNFSYIAVTLAPAVATSITVYGKKLGLWKHLFTDNSSARYFDWNYINFEKFSFKTDTSPINVRKRIWVGVVDKAQFRFENNELNEPFGIYDVTIEYTETGKF